MPFNRTKLIHGALFLASIFLTACGGGGGGTAAPASTYTIGGTVTGLTGTGLVLQNNAGNDLTITGNGSFTFTTRVANSGGYNVTVLAQPSGQTCSASSNSGTVAGANITSVAVTCSAITYTIGGTVTGLTGAGLVLQNNSGNNLSITTDGGFIFSSRVADGGGYNVTVKTQPANGQTCSASSNSGTVAGANITTVVVTCSLSSYTIGGSVSGLIGTVVLQNNSADNLTITANGSFTFAAPVANSGGYNVTVLAQPSGQTCSASTSSGTVAGANITAVAVTCTGNPYTIGGSIYGYTGTGLVLQNNGGDNLLISANGAFTFTTPITSGSAYNVTVKTQPSGQTCSASSNSGAVSAANIVSVAVICSTVTYTVGGNVSGLTGTVVLQNNGADDLTIVGNGAFTFATPVANGSGYSVTVLTQPSGQTCSASSNSGTVSGANISAVVVTCSANTYSISGTVTSLTGTGLVLQNNAGNDLSITANGSFTFTTAVPGGSPYNVSVLTQPTGQFCTVTSGTGTVSAAVTTVALACAPVYSIGGTVTGLSGTGLVLQNNGGDNLLISVNGPFTFSTKLVDLAPYAVTELSRPRSPPQDCVVTGNGNVAGGIVTGVTVSCTTANPAVLLDVPRYAFVANSNDHTVSGYIVDAATGQLRPNGYVYVGANTGPSSVAVDPSGKFAYVANSTGDSVSAYTINSGGTLTLAAAAVPAGTGPSSVTVDPSGRFAYVTNTLGQDITAYSINVTTGVPTRVSCSGGVAAGCSGNNELNYLTGANATSISVAPGGQYAYVSHNSGVSAYAIGSTGALTATDTDSAATGNQASIAAGKTPNSVSIDPSGRYAYVANGGGNVSAYSVDTAGALSSLTTATLTGSLRSVAVDPYGLSAYVVANNGGISTFNISGTGTLSPSGTPLSAGTGPASVIVDPSGKFTYVANSTSADVSVYTIAPGTGALTAAGSVRSRAGSASIAMTKGNAAVTYTPKFAYVANSVSGDVSGYSIGAGGALASITTDAVNNTPTIGAGTTPNTVTVDPSGRFAYVANSGSGDVSGYSINASTGALTQMNNGVPYPAGTAPSSVTVDPSGRFAYVADSGSVLRFSINSGTGALASLGTATAGTTPSSVTIDPAGRFAYVANTGSADVTAYIITTSSGALSKVPCDSLVSTCNGASGNFVAGTSPSSVTVDPSGKFAYVANKGSHDISAYTIDAGTGGLVVVAGSPFTAGALTAPSSIAIDPAGRYAYVANSGNDTVSAYAIDAGTGALGAGSPIATGVAPTSVTVDISGSYVYVAHSTGVSAYTINPSTGALTGGTSIAAGTVPVSVTTIGTIQ